MTPQEAAFIAKLRESFNLEGEEHLKAISEGLLQLENHPPSETTKEILETIYREAHNLKGAARAVNITQIQDLCQELETFLSAWKDGKVSPTRPSFDTIYEALTCVRKIIQEPDSLPPLQHEEILKRLQDLGDQKPIPLEQVQPVLQKAIDQAKAKSDELSPHSEPLKATTIRVSISKLDRLLQQAEELLIVKLMSAQRVKEIHAIRETCIQGKKRWNQFTPEEKERYYEELETQIHAIMKESTQDHRVVSALVDNLLEQSKAVLMQPFHSLLDQFPMMVRELAHSLEKDVKLEMQGGEIEVDKRILEEMKDPLIHLIRNSIDHGIESTDERVKVGKQATGSLTIAVNQTSGNKVSISVADDGRGINVGKLKETAIKKGLYTQHELDLMNDEELYKLIYRSGMSTSPIVSELSGRGLGMGIVAEKVEKLGGTIKIHSVPGKGIKFEIILPLTLATFRGIHVGCGQHEFILPTSQVIRVLRLPTDAIKTIENKAVITWEHTTIPYAPLDDLLGMAHEDSNKMQEPNKRTFVILKASEQYLALGVDKIFSEQEVFIKGLGANLVRVRNISAATIMEGGKIIPILDPYDLVKTALDFQIPHRMNAAPAKSDAAAVKSLLVVEDSVTARMLIKNILESAGYRVRTAVDGAEAYALLATETFDLLVSDVEMPRLNGFELCTKIRTNDKLKHLPIVLCTSRGSKEDREHGIEVGANAYINKSSFAQSNLLEIVKNLL